jgi:hypothetical protein
MQWLGCRHRSRLLALTMLAVTRSNCRKMPLGSFSLIA